MVENDDDKTIAFFLNCNNLGAQFVQAVADDVNVVDILEPTYVPDIVNSFFSMNGVLNYLGISKPLLVVQVTELADGIFIGCTLNHCIADGTSFWHFFNTWSEISRGNIDPTVPTSQSLPPIFQRSFFDGIINFPIHIPFHHSEIPIERLIPSPLKQRIFHFSKEKIAHLKAKANAEMGTNNISSPQTVMGHLWQSVVRSQHCNTNQKEIQAVLAFSVLALIKFLCCTVTSCVRSAIGWVASQINKAIASRNSRSNEKVCRGLGEAPKIVKLSSLVSNKLIIGSSPWFNVFGNDFGWGRPIAVRTSFANKYDGKLAVFSGIEEAWILKLAFHLRPCRLWQRM
uniref:Acetyltransferase n=1 Tax=Fagus sylvatica TaxID=28930 RepID=A0A2N9HUD6_FAGSY